MEPIKTVLFDLDGTLLHTLPDIYLSLNHVLSLFGFPLRTIEEVRSFVGNSARRPVEQALPPDKKSQLDLFARDYGIYYAAHCLEHTEYYPGIQNLISELKDRGIQMGVVTSKPVNIAENIICHFFGESISVIEGRRAGRPSKPSPAAILDALDALGAESSSAVYVGDSEADALTAKNAGIRCVLVSWGYRDRAELESCGALGVIDQAEELLRYIG